MRSNLDKLLVRLREFQDSGGEISLLPMFGAFTNDVISEYAYGFSLNWVQAPRFNQVFFDMVGRRTLWSLISMAETFHRLTAFMTSDLLRSSSSGSCRSLPGCLGGWY